MAEAAIKGNAMAPSPDGAAYTRSVERYLDHLRDCAEGAEVSAWHSEIAMAWDCATRAARILPSRNHRDYGGRKASEIVGTADVVLVGDDRVLVSDLKTGRGAREEPAKNSGQLRMLALCAARIFGASSATIELYHIDQDSERSYADQHSLDAFDLLDIEDEIASVYADAASGSQVPKPGPHCYSKWCPIAANCPATLATLARIDESAASDLPMVPTIESEEQARRVRIGLKLIDEHIKAKVEAWKTALHEYVSRNGPVDLGGGKWYGAVEKSRDVLDLRHEHLDLMKRIMGEDAATAAIEIATSKAAIERALKERQTKRGEGIAKSRELYDALRSEGAMRRSTFVTFSDFKQRNDSNDDEGEAA